MASEPVIDQFGSEATTREEDGSEQAEDTLKEPGEQDLCLESIQLCPLKLLLPNRAHFCGGHFVLSEYRV